MSANDDIYDAVRSAIDDGMTVEQFLKSSWLYWDTVTAENLRYANMAFEKALSK